MVADCHGKVKLQIRVDDMGSVCINSIENKETLLINHATIRHPYSADASISTSLTVLSI